MPAPKPTLLSDICDTLKGRYPKDFKFTGWHPQCRCHAVTILKTEQEMAEDTQRILAGQEPTQGSVNAVSAVPDAFKDWVEEHSDRIEMGGNLPYFIRDNQSRVNNILGLTTIGVGNDEYFLNDLIAQCEIVTTTNGKVYLHPNHGKGELAENLEFARWRAEQFGEEVILLPNPQGVKSPDSYNITRGVLEEYKRATVPTENAVSQLIRKGAHQADYLIIEPHTDMSPAELRKALTSRINDTPPPRCSNLKEIRIKVSDSEAVYTREQIVAPGFKIKPEDFRNASISRSQGSSLTSNEAGSISDAKVAKFFELDKKTPKIVAPQPKTAAYVAVDSVEAAIARAKSYGIATVDFADASLDEINTILEVFHQAHLEYGIDLNRLRLVRNLNTKDHSAGSYNFGIRILTLDLEGFKKSYYQEAVSYADKIAKLQSNKASLMRQIEQSEARLGRSKASDRILKNDIKAMKSRMLDIDLRIKKFDELIKAGYSELPFTVADSFKEITQQMQARTWHEIGHHIDDLLGRPKFREGNLISEYAKEMRVEEFAEWFSFYKMKGAKGVPADLLRIFRDAERKHIDALTAKSLSGAINGNSEFANLLRQRRDALTSSRFTLSKELKIEPQLQTGKILQSKKTLNRIIQHCQSEEEINAVEYIWSHTEKLRHVKVSELGEGKDMTAAKNVKNIQSKRKRGVIRYHEYEFSYNGIIWSVKLEETKYGFEQFYFLKKK